MRFWPPFLVLGLLVSALLTATLGCGSTYHLVRTTPDGSSLVADVWTAEKVASMEFGFEGDGKGGIKSIALKKTDAEPVNLTAQTLQSLIGLASSGLKVVP